MDSLKDYADHVINGGILDRTERMDFLKKFNEEKGVNYQEDGTMAQIYQCVKEIVEPEGEPAAIVMPELTEEEKADIEKKLREALNDNPPVITTLDESELITSVEEAQRVLSEVVPQDFTQLQTPPVEKKSVIENANSQEPKAE